MGDTFYRRSFETEEVSRLSGSWEAKRDGEMECATAVRPLPQCIAHTLFSYFFVGFRGEFISLALVNPSPRTSLLVAPLSPLFIRTLAVKQLSSTTRVVVFSLN